jgi:hypothetical protein
VATGPIPPNVTQDLEQLKLSLAAMEGTDLSENDARALKAEISAIRLQLQRLAFEREAAVEAARRASRT